MLPLPHGCFALPRTELDWSYFYLGDRDYVDAIALNLQNFYMGVERIFGEIARTLAGSMPKGDDCHQRLLEQMNLPNTPKRWGDWVFSNAKSKE